MPLALRTLLSVVFAAGAFAADAAPETLSPSGLPEFHAGGSVTWSSDPAKPSVADGGVTARYESVLLAGERLTMIQQPIPGTKVSTPADADLTAGPNGPTPTTVTIDTRQATLPNIGFKGLFSPSAVHIRRLPPDAARPAAVRWHVALPDAGSFAGQLRLAQGWAPFHGWAEHAEFEIEGTLIAGAVKELRVVQILLHSRPAAGDVPVRNAEINRLRPEAPLPAPGEDPTPEQIGGHIDAQTVILTFDASGAPGVSLKGNSHVGGDPQLFTTRDAGPAKP